MSKPVKTLVDLIEARRDIFYDRIYAAMKERLFSRIRSAVSPDGEGDQWHAIASPVQNYIGWHRDPS